MCSLLFVRRIWVPGSRILFCYSVQNGRSEMVKALGLSVFLGISSNRNELQQLVSVIDSIDWSALPIANNHRPKGWRHSSSHSSGRLKIAGDFDKYNPQTFKLFVTAFCFSREMKLSTQQSSSRCSPAVSALASDEVNELSVARNTNFVTHVSARCSWMAMEVR